MMQSPQNIFTSTVPNLLMKGALLSTLGNFNCSLLENTSKVLTQTLLFGNTSLSLSNNSKILGTAIDFILSTKRFDCLTAYLKAHPQISKKRCFEKCCSCDKACQS